LLAALLWSTGGLFIKEVTLDAWGVSFWRSSFAAITLYVVYRFQRKEGGGDAALHASKASVSDWFTPFTIIGAVTYALLLVLFVLATKLTTSANAIFLQYTAPVYVLFVEPMLARSKMKRADLCTVLISLAAMALFFVGKFEARSVWGNIFALTSGVAFAAYAIMLKHERATQENRMQMVIVGHIIIVASMGLIRLISPIRLMPPNGDLLRLAYLGIFQIGIAYALFTYGISRVRAIDATLIAMVEPVLNPVWVYLGIGERPTNFAIAGGAIILIVSIVRTIRGAGGTVDALTEVETARAGE
jgi:drug/metabolite transporter (DMT)-like permease